MVEPWDSAGSCDGRRIHEQQPEFSPHEMGLHLPDRVDTEYRRKVLYGERREEARRTLPKLVEAKGDLEIIEGTYAGIISACACAVYSKEHRYSPETCDSRRTCSNYLFRIHAYTRNR